MQTIGSFWWLWLVLFIASFSCAMVVAFKGGLKITFGLLDLILLLVSGRSGREEVSSKQSTVQSVDEELGASEKGDEPLEIEKSSSNEGDSKKGSVIGNLILLVVTGIGALVTSLLFALSIIVNLIRLATGH